MQNNEDYAVSNRSVVVGSMVIGGTIIGAGMFALPIVLSGSWFSLSILVLLFTWFCMLHSGLMLLEANLHYPVGSSFNTITKDLLGNKWNILCGITVAFVLYILTYAYISASGSIINHTLTEKLGTGFASRNVGLLYTIFVASVVWYSTSATSRITSFILGVKILAFVIVFGTLFFDVKPAILLNSMDTEAVYWPYLLAALPVCLASFGFHGNVSSLIIYYGKEKPRKIAACIIYGTLIALALYSFWLYCTMGNIPRDAFKQIIADGGNVDSLTIMLGAVNKNAVINFFLLVFSNLAVASSFFGVTLGLFDYLADLFKFDNSRLGRAKTAFITFAPPAVLCYLYPEGFVYAIGCAGLAATVWAVITPALLARKARQKFPTSPYKVWGGSALQVVVILFGLLNILAWGLDYFGLIPVFK